MDSGVKNTTTTWGHLHTDYVLDNIVSMIFPRFFNAVKAKQKNVLVSYETFAKILGNKLSQNLQLPFK